MAQIMVVAKYPQHQVQAVVETSLATRTEYPEYVQKVHDWAVQAHDQYKNYNVYECSDENLAEAIKFLTKRFSKIAMIQGYEFKIELLLDADEAIKIFM